MLRWKKKIQTQVVFRTVIYMECIKTHDIAKKSENYNFQEKKFKGKSP